MQLRGARAPTRPRRTVHALLASCTGFSTWPGQPVRCRRRRLRRAARRRPRTAVPLHSRPPRPPRLPTCPRPRSAMRGLPCQRLPPSTRFSTWTCGSLAMCGAAPARACRAHGTSRANAHAPRLGDRQNGSRAQERRLKVAAVLVRGQARGSAADQRARAGRKRLQGRTRREASLAPGRSLGLQCATPACASHADRMCGRSHVPGFNTCSPLPPRTAATCARAALQKCDTLCALATCLRRRL